MKFEQRLQRLEKISEEIRDEEVDLERAIELFEEGMKLAKGLEKELAKIERRVEILVNEPEPGVEKPDLELFPELSESRVDLRDGVDSTGPSSDPR